MNFSYWYPALAHCTPPGCRTVRNAIVALSGETDVPEVEEGDAPIACAFTVDDNSYVYRYRDGAFYASAGEFDVSAAGPATLPDKALEGLQLDLVMDMSEDAGGNGTDVWPSSAYLHIGIVATERGSRSPFTGTTLHDHDLENYGRKYGRKNAYYASEVGGIDAADLDFWGGRARERVGSAFVLAGEVWCRVAEPLIMLAHLDTRWDRFCDTDLYRCPDSRFIAQPLPFGRANHPSGGYWDEFARVFPMSEVDRALAALRASPPEARSEAWARDVSGLSEISVSMPEVFGNGHAARELERQSRIAVHAEWVGKTFMSSASATDQKFHGSVARIRAFLPSGGAEPDDGLADAVEDYADLRKASERSVPGRNGLFVKTRTAALRQAVSDFRSRPISLEAGGIVMSNARGIAP